jgi:hypothetical protein
MWDSILLYSHMYTQQSPHYVWIYHYIATLPLKRKPFINLMGPLQRYLWAMWVCLGMHLNLSLLRELLFCVRSMNLFAPSRTLVYADNLHLCSYSKNPRQAHAMTLCLTLRTFIRTQTLHPFVPMTRTLCLCLCHSTIPHTTINSDTIC